MTQTELRLQNATLVDENRRLRIENAKLEAELLDLYFELPMYMVVQND